MSDQGVVQDVRKYLAIAHKRRGLIAACLAASLTAALLYNYSTRPLYRATAQILIDIKGPELLPGQATSTRIGGEGDLQTEYQLLGGRALAEDVVKQLDLQKSPEFQTGPLMSPWERFQRRFLGRVPSSTVSSDGLPLSPAAAAFRSRLTIEPQPGGRLINLHFRAYDPRIAADAVNALAQLYIEQALRLRLTTSSEATGWLSDRVREQEARLKEAERALREYAGRHGIDLDQQQTLAEQKQGALLDALATARAERIAREGAYGQVRGLPGSALVGVAAVLDSPSVQGLRARQLELQAERARLSATLGEKHPDMVRLASETEALEARMRSEAEAVARHLEADYRAAAQKEASLQRQVEGARRDAQTSGLASIELGALRREVDSQQRILTDLITRNKQTDLVTELKSANIRIIEKAELPQAPISPNRMANYRLALLLGLALGIGLVLAFEHFDNTFRTPEDVKEHLGLPFLGMVPDASGRPAGPNAAKASPLILRNPQSAAAESYRVLRTNLLFSFAEGTGKVLLVTSAGPGEGKTTTVVNLAASIALNGARVLTVDADLRRPTMHQHFGVGKMPGLSDLIVGKAAPSQAIQPTKNQGLQVLPCGYIAPNPAELLGSQGMRDVIEALRKHYDWVLIDTPPLLGMADTAVLCPYVDGVVLVIGSEVANRAAVQRAAEQAGTASKVVGVVLNRVNLERNSYYYAQYYGEYYHSYYAEGSSKPHKAARGG